MGLVDFWWENHNILFKSFSIGLIGLSHFSWVHFGNVQILCQSSDSLALDCTWHWLTFCVLCLCGDSFNVFHAAHLSLFFGLTFQRSVCFLVFSKSYLVFFFFYQFYQVLSLSFTNFCFYLTVSLSLFSQLYWLLGLISAPVGCGE